MIGSGAEPEKRAPFEVNGKGGARRVDSLDGRVRPSAEPQEYHGRGRVMRADHALKRNSRDFEAGLAIEA
jgi:hypothetical protein